MATYSVNEAGAQLARLIEAALAGEQVIISDGNLPPVILMPAKQIRPKRIPGSGKGQLLYMAADFDATPPEFEEDDP